MRSPSPDPSVAEVAGDPDGIGWWGGLAEPAALRMRLASLSPSLISLDCRFLVPLVTSDGDPGCVGLKLPLWTGDDARDEVADDRLLSRLTLCKEGE